MVNFEMITFYVNSVSNVHYLHRFTRYIVVQPVCGSSN